MKWNQVVWSSKCWRGEPPRTCSFVFPNLRNWPLHRSLNLLAADISNCFHFSNYLSSYLEKKEKKKHREKFENEWIWEDSESCYPYFNRERKGGGGRIKIMDKTTSPFFHKRKKKQNGSRILQRISPSPLLNYFPIGGKIIHSPNRNLAFPSHPPLPSLFFRRLLFAAVNLPPSPSYVVKLTIERQGTHGWARYLNLKPRIIDPDNNNNNFSIIIICTSITNSLRNSRFSKKKEKKFKKRISTLETKLSPSSPSLSLLPSLPAMEKIPTSRHKIEYSLLVPLRYGIYNSETEMASFSSASIRV